ELVMRGDTLQFSPLGGPDQWFKSNNKFSVLRTTGTWAVHRKKYIVCKPDTSGRNPNIPDFILSVIALTDSSMVLQKLHTSNLDMFRTYYFSTKPGRNMRERMAGDAMMYYPPVNLRSVKYSHMEGLDSVTI